MKENFAGHDVDMNGEIDMAELRRFLGEMGEIPTERQLQVRT